MKNSSNKLSVKLSLIVILSFFFFGCSTESKDPSKNPINPGALSVPVSQVGDISDRLTSNNKDIGELSKNVLVKVEKIIVDNPKVKEAVEVKSTVEKISYVNSEKGRKGRKCQTCINAITIRRCNSVA